MNSDRFYFGFGAHFVRILTADGVRILKPRFDLDNHSPSGFSWGYGGSGPAQLALAILADALGDDARAVRLHQAFKWRVTAPLIAPCWVISIDEVRQTVAGIEAEVGGIGESEPVEAHAP